MSSEPYAEVVNGNYCDVCGKDGPDLDPFPVEVCRLCYAGVEERARVREEERDVYRAALADLVAGMAGARERAIAALSGRPIDPGVARAMAGGDRDYSGDPPTGK